MPAKKKKAAAKKKSAKKPAKKAAKKVSAIPKHYHAVTPFLTVDDGNAAIDFYKKAFGAKELSRMPGPDGKIMHSELIIGDSVVVVVDEMPGMSKSPKSLGGSPSGLMIYTKDADAAAAKAQAAGAKLVMPVADQFWGDRYGQLEDPFGYKWAIGTHIKDMTAKQIQVAQDAFFAMMAAGGAPPAQAAG